MAEVTPRPPSTIAFCDQVSAARHAVLVRMTHWINTVVLIVLLISGGAILLAHPRLYWGETGFWGSPALIDLPLPLNLEQSGWGRSLHFLAAWVFVLNGTIYVLWGLRNRHFLRQQHYSVLQRVTYLGVVFVLVPAMIWTGLAMSPAITSVVPLAIELLGGYQSARTIHFFGMNVLVAFVVLHVAMVYVSGFKSKMRGMITGREDGKVHA